jgi:hypothetical protein
MKGTRLIYKVIPNLVLNILKVMGVLFLFVIIWGPSSNHLLISIWPTTQGTFSCTFQNIYHGWNVNNGRWISFNEWNVNNHGWISSIIKFEILGLTWFKCCPNWMIKKSLEIFFKWLINWPYKVIVN